MKGNSCAPCPLSSFLWAGMCDENQLPCTTPWEWWQSNNSQPTFHLPPKYLAAWIFIFEMKKSTLFVDNTNIFCEPFVTAAQHPHPNQYKTLPRLHPSSRLRVFSSFQNSVSLFRPCELTIAWIISGCDIDFSQVPCLSPPISWRSQHCGLWISDLFRLPRLSSQTGPA